MVDSETLEQQVLHVKDAKVVGGPIYVGKAYEHRPPGEKERPRAVLVDMRAEPEGRGEEFLDTGNVGQVLRWPSDHKAVLVTFDVKEAPRPQDGGAGGVEGGAGRGKEDADAEKDAEGHAGGPVTPGPDQKELVTDVVG